MQKERTLPTAVTVLLCLLCLLPAVLPLTITEVDTIWFVDENGMDWWLLSNSFTYSDRWYLVIETIGSILIVSSVLAMLRSNRERAALGVTVRQWLSRYLTVVLLLFILAWATVSMLLSGRLERCLWGTGYRHDGLFSYMIYGGVMLSACVLARRGEGYVRAVLECFALVGTASAVVVMFQIDGPWLDISNDIRAGFFCQYNHQGYFNTMTWTSCAVLYLMDAQRRARLPHGKSAKQWALLLLRLAELWLLTNEILACEVRGSFLAVIFAAIMLNLFLLKRKELRKGLAVLDALFILTFSVLNTDSAIFSRLSVLGQELSALREQLKNGTLEKSTLNKVGSTRGWLWSCGIRFALEKPIFGYGPDNLGEQFYALKAGNDRPHNEYIQIAAMLGFPALVAYLAAMGTHYLRFLRNHKRCGLLCVGCMCIAGGYLANAFVGNSMYYTTPYFFMCLGFSLGLYLNDTRNTAQLVRTEEENESSCDI